MQVPKNYVIHTVKGLSNATSPGRQSPLATSTGGADSLQLVV